MQSSELSVSQNKAGQPRYNFLPRLKNLPNNVIRPLVWLVRLLLGAVFVFSGFSKAVDPWGGLYKIADYLHAWGFQPSHEISLILGCVLALFEFVTGVMLLIGAYRRVIRWVLLVFMAFMTVLTLYIWIADPVSDCGCFGDALILSNAMTFWKNVFLLLLTGIIFLYNMRVNPLILPQLQWIAIIVTCLYVFAIEIYGYHIQPLIDFRPYPVGTDLAELASENDDVNLLFVYEKNGIKQTFTIDNLPDESWTFVERQTPENESNKSVISIFDDEEDVTADVVAQEGEQYILLVSDPERYGISRSEMANHLYDYSTAHDADMFAVLALDTDSIESWIEQTGANYPVYSAEDTDIKMIARGDAALVALKDGIITGKINIFALPPEFPSENEDIAAQVESNGYNMLIRFTLVWFACMLVLYFASRVSGMIKHIKMSVNKDGEKANINELTK